MFLLCSTANLFAWCVRLSRLLVGFRTHFKSMQFYFILNNNATIVQWKLFRTFSLNTMSSQQRLLVSLICQGLVIHKTPSRYLIHSRQRWRQMRSSAQIDNWLCCCCCCCCCWSCWCYCSLAVSEASVQDDRILSGPMHRNQPRAVLQHQPIATTWRDMWRRSIQNTN